MLGGAPRGGRARAAGRRARGRVAARGRDRALRHAGGAARAARRAATPRLGHAAGSI